MRIILGYVGVALMVLGLVSAFVCPVIWVPTLLILPGVILAVRATVMEE